MSDLKGARDPPAQPGIPQWIIDNAAERDAPFHEALRVELFFAEMAFGLPLPEKDPIREDKRRQATRNQRVLQPERFGGDDEHD